MRSRAALVVLLLATCGLAACGPAQAPVSSASNAAKQVSDFELAEEEILRDLAALDRRLAQRARIEPREDDLQRIAMAGILADDPTLVVIDGAIDPFSFDARARGLAAAKKKIAALPTGLPARAPGKTPALERDLLTRLVDEEVLRLEEERALPRSASALVRAVVETWTPPKDAEEVPVRDRWLARRLNEIRTALENGALDVVRARELDDALDALEKIVGTPGYVKSTQELVRVRETLEAQSAGKASPASPEWPEMLKKLRGHLGVTISAEQIEAELDRAEKTSAERATAAARAAGLSAEDLAKRSTPLLFAEGDCADQVPGSRMRSLAPSLERRWSCHLRHELSAAHGDSEVAAVYASLHDHVVVARWALDVARGKGTLAEARARHHLLRPPELEVEARLERIALARPIAAIGAGLTAALLLASPDAFARARLMTQLGELPLDLAARELAR